MLIDWFTVVAQALNFAVLLWLMKRFLYRPVLDAIDAREKRIADGIADAAAKQAEAQGERDAFRGRNASFDRERDAMLARATDEVAVERRRLSDEAAAAATAEDTRRQDALGTEAAALRAALGSRTEQVVFEIVGKVLGDLATVTLEAQVCTVFLARLRALDGKARGDLAEAVRTAKDGAVVRSAFDLAPAQRSAIDQALHEVFGTMPPLRFESAPDLVAGLELVVGGQKLDWNIAHYVDALSRSVETLVELHPPKAADRGPDARGAEPLTGNGPNPEPAPAAATRRPVLAPA